MTSYNYNNTVIFHHCVYSDFQSISKDSKLSKLKHLDLGFNRLGKGILGSLGALLTLKSLKLDYNYIGALFTSYMPFGNALLFVKFGTAFSWVNKDYPNIHSFKDIVEIVGQQSRRLDLFAY